MQTHRHPTASGTLGRCALVVGLIACLVHLGCQPADPLTVIRQKQASGDVQGTLEPLRELLEESPDDPELNYLYGRALALTQQGYLATWSLRKAMQDPEWRVRAGLQIALIALGTYDFNEADKITTEVLEQEPDNVTALLLRANTHAHWRKDPEQALADADRVLELDPERLEAYEPRILALLALERREEAAASLAEVGERLAEQHAPDEILAWHCTTTAVLQNEMGDPDAARATWDRCLEEHPSNLEVVGDATGFHDALGETERSLEIVRTALAAAPGSRVLRTNLAERLKAAGEVAEGEALLREATEEQDPALAAAAWLDLGKYRQGLGEYGPAAEAIGRAVELAQEAGPPSPQLAFDYADALVLAGRLDQALEQADRLTVEAHRHLIRARVAQERGDSALALEEFGKGLALWPDNPWARYQAALAAEDLGDFDRALEELRYAIRIAPEATDARTRAGKLLLAEGKARQADEVLRTGAGKAPLDLEGQLLMARLAGMRGDLAFVKDTLERLHPVQPVWAAWALRDAAEGTAVRRGPAAALAMLGTAPGIDYRQPVHAAALRALVGFAHEAGEAEAARPVLDSALAAHPGAGVFVEIQGLDLELSGSRDRARAAYRQALEIEPRNRYALTGLARLALPEDPAEAVEYYDRAAALAPADPEPAIEAARARVATGQLEEAAERLDAVLREHPYEAEAAALRARIDLDRGVATARTLERAQRAVRFRGGADALDLLSRAYEIQGQPERAARAAARATALRAARPPADRAEAEATEG